MPPEATTNPNAWPLEKKLKYQWPVARGSKLMAQHSCLLAHGQERAAWTRPRPGYGQWGCIRGPTVPGAIDPGVPRVPGPAPLAMAKSRPSFDQVKVMSHDP